MQNIQQIVNSLIDKKAKENNTIDLNAYAVGALDALEKSNAPEFLEEIQDTIDDLKLLKSTILDASKINNKLESVVEVIQNWIDRKEQLIKEATEL